MSSLKKYNKTNILFIAPYPTGLAPGQRFRYELFYGLLNEKGISFQIQNLLTVADYKNLYSQGGGMKKLFALFRGMVKRVILIFRIKQFSHVFLFREAFFFGPPIFEWIIAKVFRKKVIYDFDDAIWLPDPNGERGLWRILKWRSKVASICKWSWKVSTGNEYLAAFARKYSHQVVVLPTMVNTEIHISDETKKDKKRLTIGWTGSHSTLFYLNEILPILQELENEIAFDFLVIANKNPELPLKNFRFLQWNKATEIEDLSKIDIGVMPLEDNEWSQGKCGFKLIQYLALGIPAIASPVGVNNEIIIEGETGFLANSNDDWANGLLQLLNNASLRERLGKNGRQLIEKKYSVKSQENRFLDLFED